jgi:hypothetical protein
MKNSSTARPEAGSAPANGAASRVVDDAASAGCELTPPQPAALAMPISDMPPAAQVLVLYLLEQVRQLDAEVITLRAAIARHGLAVARPAGSA